MEHEPTILGNDEACRLIAAMNAAEAFQEQPANELVQTAFSQMAAATQRMLFAMIAQGKSPEDMASEKGHGAPEDWGKTSMHQVRSLRAKVEFIRERAA